MPPAALAEYPLIMEHSMSDMQSINHLTGGGVVVTTMKTDTRQHWQIFILLIIFFHKMKS